MNQRTVPGVLLIVIGVALLAANQAGVGGEMVVALIGAAFLVAFGYTRNYGFLVPGAIMTGLGIGIILETGMVQSNGAPVLLGLGLGFVTIYAVDRLTLSDRPGGWWPLIPGGVLSLIGLSLALEATGLLFLLERWWPLLLVLIGVWMILRPRART